MAAPRENTMKCKVLIAGRYNDKDDKAADYAPGDILDTGVAYGETLIADGFVEAAAGEPEPAIEPEPEKPQAKAAPRKGRKSNPFAPEA